MCVWKICIVCLIQWPTIFVYIRLSFLHDFNAPKIYKFHLRKDVISYYLRYQVIQVHLFQMLQECFVIPSWINTGTNIFLPSQICVFPHENLLLTVGHQGGRGQHRCRPPWLSWSSAFGLQTSWFHSLQSLFGLLRWGCSDQAWAHNLQ